MLYKKREKPKGIISDNLLATDAIANPLFCTVIAIRLKITIKEDELNVYYE